MTDIFLYAGEANKNDVRLRDPTKSGFPVQFAGFRIEKGGVALDLCLVAIADAPSGMGGQPRIQKGGVTYAIYIVETTDPNASAVRVKTTTGIKAVRKKT